MKAPCYKCEDRNMTCHSTCNKYKAFRKGIDDFKEEKREYDNYLYDAMRRMSSTRKSV